NPGVTDPLSVGQGLTIPGPLPFGASTGITIGMYNDHDRNKTYAAGGTNAGLILPLQPAGDTAPTLVYNPSDNPGSGGVPETGTPPTTTMSSSAVGGDTSTATPAPAKG